MANKEKRDRDEDGDEDEDREGDGDGDGDEDGRSDGWWDGRWFHLLPSSACHVHLLLLLLFGQWGPIR